MGICWSCYWGWPKPVADIYDKALIELDGDESPLHYGPGHVVWADENFDHAEWCLENFDRYRGDYSESDLGIVKQSLVELSELPIDTRCIVPDDYDGKNPKLFPPPKNVEVVRR